MTKQTPLSKDGSHHISEVDLTSFVIIATKAKVFLEWETDNEIGVIGFAIERRMMDDEQWTQIGFVAGSGTQFARRIYNFEDIIEKASLISYRLRRTSVDGSYNYSREVSVTIKKNIDYILYPNFPNPFIDVTSISFQIPEITGDVVLKIKNMNDVDIRLLYEKPAISGYYNVEWNGNNNDGKMVGPGVYTCYLTTEAGELYKKVMKLSYNPKLT